MAQKLSVVIVGETSGLRSAFRDAQIEADTLGSKFKNLASSAISLTAGLAGIAGAAGVVKVLKDSIQAAEGFNAALRSTNDAIRSTGGSVQAYTGTVSKLADSGVRLGYTNTQVLDGFRTMTLVTGNATDAVKYMGLAEDIAKAKGIDLSTAATAVGKAIDGKATSLQRYGIVVAKGEPIEQALADAQKRYAGQAAANTTVTQQLSATIGNLEVKIGQALLPTVEKVATAIEGWISKAKNQKAVTDDVRKAVQLATTAFNDIKTAITDVDKVTGGFKQTMEDLLALKVVSVLASWTAGLAGSAGVGAAASTAERAVSSLRATLLGMAGMTIGVGILVGLNMIPKSSTGQSVLNQTGLGGLGHAPLIGGLATQAANAGNYLRGVFGEGKIYTGPSAHQQALDANAVANLTHSLTASGRWHPGLIADAKGGTAGAGMLPSSFQGGPGGAPAGAAKSSKGKKAPAYKIPQALEAAIRKAQQTFADSITEQHLDTVTGLERQEESLLKSHGQLAKAASVANEITKATETFQKNLAKQQATAAKNAIAAIEQQTVGPAQTLKLAQGTHQPIAEILSDQDNLVAAYQVESAQLKSKLASATGQARTLLKAALTKIQTSITNTRDQVAQTLDTIATTAQSHLQTVISSIESAADSALGAQYYQGGQTPSEAALAAMQAQDTIDSLNTALQQAQAQYATDAGTGATGATLQTDQQAITAAQRAITENKLATQATAERAQADAAFAKAEYNLNSQIEALSQNVGDGSTIQGALNALLKSFGINLNVLSDPGGNGLLSSLTAAIGATTSAFQSLTAAMGGKQTSVPYQFFSTGTSAGVTNNVTVNGVVGSPSEVAVAVGNAIATQLRGGRIPSLAQAIAV